MPTVIPIFPRRFFPRRHGLVLCAALVVFASGFACTHRAAAQGPVLWVASGGLEPTAFEVRAKLVDPSKLARLRVTTDPRFTADGLADARSLEPAMPINAASVAIFRVTGLKPGISYHYGVEVAGELVRSHLGTVRTPPDGPFSFTVAFASCAKTGSEHPVYDTIRSHDPLVFLHLGDLHYENLEVADPKPYRRALDTVLGASSQARLYRATPLVYIWDDHDFGGNNSDPTHPGTAVVQQVYREVVPRYPLVRSESGSIHHAFTIGRVRFLATDARSGRAPRDRPDGPEKTMLGTEQKAWLKKELRAANGRYPVIVWLMTVPWISEPEKGADHWGGYTAERAELARFLEEEDIRGLVMLSGDGHMLALDDGSNNRYGPAKRVLFPVMHGAALDKRGSRKGGPYSHGSYPGGGQFGLMTVEDDGGEVVGVRLSGRDHTDREIVGWSFEIAVAD